MNIHVACKMGHKRMCPDSDKKKKKKSPKRHTFMVVAKAVSSAERKIKQHLDLQK